MKTKTFLFCIYLLVISFAMFRPDFIGRDTLLYKDSFIRFQHSDFIFPDLTFNTLAFFVGFLPLSYEISAQIFLWIVLFISFLLMIKTLSNVDNIKGLLIILMLPLGLFDIMRQGLAMLFAGVSLKSIGNKNKFAYLFLACSTHITSLVTFFYMIKKVNLIYFFTFLFLIILMLFLSQDFWIPRLEAYTEYRNALPNDIYQLFEEFQIRFVDKVTFLNFITFLIYIFFCFYNRSEIKSYIFLTIIYILSIAYPLIFRVYYFLFFLFIIQSESIEIRIGFFNKIYLFLLILLCVNFSLNISLREL